MGWLVVGDGDVEGFEEVGEVVRAERLLAHAIRLPLQRLLDYPGSAIGWDDHIIPNSAFDVELPGGQLSAATVRVYAAGLRSLAHTFATH